MSDLKITKGVACAEKYKNSWTVNCGIYPVATRSGWLPGLEEENFANADVIAETFNVAYETGLTPKQLLEQLETCTEENQILLEQRNELLDALKVIGDANEPNLIGASDPTIRGLLYAAIRVARAAIAKAEGRS